MVASWYTKCSHKHFRIICSLRSYKIRTVHTVCKYTNFLEHLSILNNNHLKLFTLKVCNSIVNPSCLGKKGLINWILEGSWVKAIMFSTNKISYWTMHEYLELDSLFQSVEDVTWASRTPCTTVFTALCSMTLPTVLRCASTTARYLTTSSCWLFNLP